MKTPGIICALILCCGAITSCRPDTIEYTFDHSLTGSISYNYLAEIDGIFDGIPLSDGVDYSFTEARTLEILKISDTEVRFDCYYRCGNERFIVVNARVSVLGKPYDVTFDHVSQDWGRILYDDGLDGGYKEYESVMSIKGWMKEETGSFEEGNPTYDPYSPNYPNFDCDITINCTIDGKELELKISRLRGV